MAKMMRAFRHTQVGKMGEVVEVAIPEPGPGQIRLKTAGAGLCHSDLLMMYADPPFGPLPSTLGHEATGWVDAIGAGVVGIKEGDAYGMYFPWGCGRCLPCVKGEENLCSHGLTQTGFAVGWDGGLADYFLADNPRHLVALGDLDPVIAAPLMCAGITTQHGVSRSLPLLVPGSTVVVIGVGGLGHLAIQIVKAMTSAKVIAVDVNAEKLAHAKFVGADEALESGPETAAHIRTLTNGIGAALVLDLVGNDKTLALAASILAQQGRLEMIGVGGGTLPLRSFGIARDASVSLTHAGSIPELFQVIELARQGLVTPDIIRIGYDEIPETYAKMDKGQLRGRAVLVPHV
jgi:alcohol dehydrogenase, propanol-preferring